MYGYPYYQNNFNQAQTSFNQGYPSFNQAQQNTMQDERIWVQNKTSAEAYLVAPGGFVRLWDSSEPVFYEKRADQSGRPYPLEVFRYTREQAKSDVPDNKGRIDYSNEINSLNERITELERRIKNVQQSYANDTAVQPIQKNVYRESRGGSEKADFYRENESKPAESASEHGYRITENDEQF